MRTEAYRIREGLIVRYAFLREDEIHEYVGTSGQYVIIKHSFDDEQVYKIIRDFFDSTVIPGISDIHFGFVNTRTSQVGWRFKPEQPHFAPDYLYYLDGISKIPPDDLLPLLDVSDSSVTKHFGVAVS